MYLVVSVLKMLETFTVIYRIIYGKKSVLGQIVVCSLSCYGNGWMLFYCILVGLGNGFYTELWLLQFQNFEELIKKNCFQS